MTDICALAALCLALALAASLLSIWLWIATARSFVARWLVGSVSKQVIHYAHCPATVVR